MSSVAVFLTVLTLATVALAADPIESTSSSCAIKGVDGPYGYDPTSDKGPADWGSLTPEYAACSSGNIQSPIDFPTSVNHRPLAEGPKPMLEANYFNFSAGSYNWAVRCSTVGTCGFTMFGGKKFTLRGIHFHSPSEHTLNGIRYPLESHFVHVSDDGDFAVIATMFQYPTEDDYAATVYKGAKVDFGMSSFLSSILAGVMTDQDKFKVFPGSIINANKGYCKYTGSLTTPPCTEGVTFFMSLNVQHASKRQVYAYSASCGSSFDGNARPVQPLNGREITCFV